MNISELKNKALEQVCKEFRVKTLYVFGSYVSEYFSEDSDLDFLVEFERAGFSGAFDQFMGLKEKLEEIYQQPVDLLTIKRFRNPLFQEEVEKSKTLVYAA